MLDSAFVASLPHALWKHLLFILLLSLEGGLGDTVQITLAGLCDAAATLVLVLLKDTNLLKSLHDLAVDGAGGVNVVGGARAAVLGGSVDLAETAYTDSLALFHLSVPYDTYIHCLEIFAYHVDVAGDGSGADVEPVDVLGRELIGVCGSLVGIPEWASQERRCQLTACLDSVNPACR